MHYFLKQANQKFAQREDIKHLLRMTAIELFSQVLTRREREAVVATNSMQYISLVNQIVTALGKKNITSKTK